MNNYALLLHKSNRGLKDKVYHNAKYVNPLMSGGNKRSCVLKQTCSFWLQICLSTSDFLLPPGIKGLKILK